MRFRVERDQFAKDLETLSRTANAATLTATTRQVCMSGAGSDRSVCVRTRTADESTPGEAVVSGKMMHRLVKACDPGAVNVAVDDGSMTITDSMGGEFTMRLLAPDPIAAHWAKRGDSFKVDRDAIVNALDSVRKTASTDDSRGALLGVRFSGTDDGMLLAATDSYRLSLVTLGAVPFDTDTTAVVPATALAEVVRLEGDEVTVTLDSNQCTFSIGNTEVTTRLLAGDYPAIERVIPSKFDQQLRVDADAMSAAIRKVMAAAGGSNVVAVELSKSQATLTYRHVDEPSGEQKIDSSWTGDTGFTFYVNANFALGGLGEFDGDVTISVIDELKPLSITSEENGLFYLLMPVRP